MNFDNTQIEMFESLYNILPKSPELWNEDDILNWLKFIKMEQYFENFKDNSVDGLIILELNEEDLKEELKINLKLHVKRVAKAIEILKKYSLYIKDIRSTNNFHFNNKIVPNAAVTNDILLNPSNNIEFEDFNKKVENKNNDKIINNEVNKNENNIEIDIYNNEEINNIEEEQINNNEINNENNNIFENDNNILNDNNDEEFKEYIIIKSIEVPFVNKYEIDKIPKKIGRHSSNDIIIFDESVSRYHALIEFIDHSFILKDIGSTTGTFLKITEPFILEKDMIIEVGSYQFLIDKININETNKEENFIVLNIYESPEEKESETFILNSGSTIGRKNNNSIFFQDDMHMSNSHCKINLIGDKFYYEDHRSTNGSWLRLSKEGDISKNVVLGSTTIFKIGNSAMYQTDKWVLNSNIQESLIGMKTITDEVNNDEVNPNTKCCICWENERDCIIIPCNHLASCMKCIKGVKNCPICRIQIDDMKLIYKNY